MKQLIIAISLLFLNIVAQSQNTSYPTIVVDAEHNNIAPNANKEIKYKIKASKGLNIDATKMDFEILMKYNGGKMPDKIFVQLESGTYITDFSTEKVVVIDKATLQPYLGNTVFAGFKKGDTPIISIGTLRLAGKSTKMAQVWANMMEVE